MDLNPSTSAVWTSIEDGPYELASFAMDQNTELLIILCAWLDSEKSPGERWDISTANYWVARLYPLWKGRKDQKNNKETVVVLCNRSGSEGGMYTLTAARVSVWIIDLIPILQRLSLLAHL